MSRRRRMLKTRIQSDGVHLRPSSNKPIHNDKQREAASNTSVRSQVQIPRRENHETGQRRLVPSLVEVNGIEPSTSCLQSRRSPN